MLGHVQWACALECSDLHKAPWTRRRAGGTLFERRGIEAQTSKAHRAAQPLTTHPPSTKVLAPETSRQSAFQNGRFRTAGYNS